MGVLLRQVHRHGAVAGVGVGLFERGTGGVDVFETALRAKKRVHRLLHDDLRQQRVAADAVLPHVKARRCLGRPGQHTNTQQ